MLISYETIWTYIKLPQETQTPHYLNVLIIYKYFYLILFQ